MKTLVTMIAFAALTGCVARKPLADDLVLLTREGCVDTTRMRTALDLALTGSGQPINYQILDVDTLPAADVRRGYPAPTVLYKGRDLFGLPSPTPPLPEPT